MAEAKTNPWIIAAMVAGAVAVFYILYSEYEASLAASTSTTSAATVTNDATGIVQSIIPDQTDSQQPSYPATAQVTSTGELVGQANTPATAEPGGVAASGANTGPSSFALPILPQI